MVCANWAMCWQRRGHSSIRRVASSAGRKRWILLSEESPFESSSHDMLGEDCVVVLEAFFLAAAAVLIVGWRWR